MFKITLEKDGNITPLEILQAHIDVQEIMKLLVKYATFYAKDIDALKETKHITREGLILDIKDMDDEHLVNSYNLAVENDKSIEKYKPEIIRRGLVERTNAKKAPWAPTFRTTLPTFALTTPEESSDDE